jgi:two-component sensor histidine kinase
VFLRHNDFLSANSRISRFAGCQDRKVRDFRPITPGAQHVSDDTVDCATGILRRAPHARVDLEELVRSEFLAQSIQDKQLQIFGPRVLLDSKAAENLGLALHELTTNSIKFGALGYRCDRVHVRWRLERQKQSRVVFDWRERVGRVLRESNSRGFGFELIERMLPYELGGSGSIIFHPDGLHCSLAFAVPPLESN